MYLARDQVNFPRVRVIKTSEAGPVAEHTYEYEVQVPDFLAKWDVWDYWERCRFDSMRDNLTDRDILFDVGAEVGWISTIYARYVGPSHMVLFEPSEDFWPNIQATWKANELADPRACWMGLVGEVTTVDHIPQLVEDPWPPAAYADRLVEQMQYKYIHTGDRLPQVTLDDWSDATSIVPTAITIDVEGAELNVLRGARRLLEARHPRVWVSIHPDLMERDYGVTPEQLIDFMSYYHYRALHLGTDHEQHWLFS